MTIAHTGWRILVNNFAVESLQMDTGEIGFMQGLRETPGLLSFTVILCLFIIREQTMMILSLILLGFGVLLTGTVDDPLHFYLTVTIMSVGFHYFQVIENSLTVQFFNGKEYIFALGQIRSATAFFTALTFALGFAGTAWLQLNYDTLFVFFGLTCMIMAGFLLVAFRNFPVDHPQTQNLVLRKKYILFYLLTAFDGARRQIFIVFASLLLVLKFEFPVTWVIVLYFVNHVVTIFMAPGISRYIYIFGERSTLLIEYSGLIIIFFLYAFVEYYPFAVLLYVLDNLFFSLSMAKKSYFKKIATPSDISATSGISFSINHIMAVFLPPLFGVIWLHSMETVFLTAAIFALCSFLLALFIPRHPASGNEMLFFRL